MSLQAHRMQHVSALSFSSRSSNEVLIRSIIPRSALFRAVPVQIRCTAAGPGSPGAPGKDGRHQLIQPLRNQSLSTRPVLTCPLTCKCSPQGPHESNAEGEIPSSESSSANVSSGLDSNSLLSSGGVPAAATVAPPVSGEFCIIEGRDTLQDFALMQEEEIKDNITSRRNRIFLLMEEIRRLRIQQRLRRLEAQHANAESDAEELPQYPSSIPFLPPLTTSTLKEYYATFAALVTCIIIFGGIVAPTLELRLGVGGQSYAEFINSLGLPMQLSAVDPIVASFSGGAVGVLSALLVVEVNNVKTQEHKKCMYCHGTGYLVCARCEGSGAVHAGASADGSLSAGSLGMAPSELRCPNCAGSAKVMCPTCLCTGRALATEHDPRIDPFDL